MNTVLAAVAGLLLVISSVNAADFDGNKLKQHLANQKKEEILYAHALGYINGVVDMTHGVLFCTPPGVTGEQIIDIVSKYLAEHPQKLHLQARDLVIDALAAAFPCRK